MDLNKTWKDLETKKISSKISKQYIENSIRNESISIFETLQKRLTVKSWYCLFFSSLIFTLLISLPYNKATIIILSLLLVPFLVFYIFIKIKLKIIKNTSLNHNLLATIQLVHNITKNILNQETVIFTTLSPFMILGSFLIPLFLKGYSVTNIISQPTLIFTLLILIPAGSIASYKFGNKLNDIVFGSYLKKLKHYLEFDKKYGEGISKTGEIIDLGVDYNIIKKSGSWFSYGDTKLGQGREAVKNLINDNPELAEELENKIIDAINNPVE